MIVAFTAFDLRAVVEDQGGDVTVDEMSEASFPASDPPATWTWEVRAPAVDGVDSDDSESLGRAG